MKKKIAFMVGLLFGLLVAAPGAAPASPFSNDAAEVADAVARSSVRTIYRNLRAEGIPWKRIRDQHLPAILTRSLGTIRQNYSREVILSDFLPTLLSSYYSEIDKINRENRITCIEYTFILTTIIPFIQECEIKLGPWRITVPQVVDLVLNVSYPYTVCGTGCKTKVKDRFSSEFSTAYPATKFSRICAE